MKIGLFRILAAISLALAVAVAVKWRLSPGQSQTSLMHVTEREGFAIAWDAGLRIELNSAAKESDYMGPNAPALTPTIVEPGTIFYISGTPAEISRWRQAGRFHRERMAGIEWAMGHCISGTNINSADPADSAAIDLGVMRRLFLSTLVPHFGFSGFAPQRDTYGFPPADSGFRSSHA